MYVHVFTNKRKKKNRSKQKKHVAFITFFFPPNWLRFLMRLSIHVYHPNRIKLHPPVDFRVTEEAIGGK